MAVRGWFTVRVDLVSGAGLSFAPQPGRIFLVGPTHTFLDLATAIDLGFARWDLSHLHEFRFADGRCFGIPDDDDPQSVQDYESVRVGAEVKRGERFLYIFDFGANWNHQCTVLSSNLDPLEVLGSVPRQPTPIWGWGWIPDQYARRSYAEEA